MNKNLKQRIVETLQPLAERAFCPTGEGGGIDNSCSPGQGGSAGLASLEKELGNGVSVGVTVGGLTNVQSSTGKSLSPKQIEICIAKMKKGDMVGVVFTQTTGTGDAQKGQSMEGVVKGFGKVKGTDKRAAIIDVTKGDAGTGEKIISPLQSLHAITWGS